MVLLKDQVKALLQLVLVEGYTLAVLVSDLFPQEEETGRLMEASHHQTPEGQFAGQALVLMDEVDLEQIETQAETRVQVVAET